MVTVALLFVVRFHCTIRIIHQFLCKNILASSVCSRGILISRCISGAIDCCNYIRCAAKYFHTAFLLKPCDKPKMLIINLLYIKYIAIPLFRSESCQRSFLLTIDQNAAIEICFPWIQNFQFCDNCLLTTSSWRITLFSRECIF